MKDNHIIEIENNPGTSIIGNAIPARDAGC